jgi:hypothetical protein
MSKNISMKAIPYLNHHLDIRLKIVKMLIIKLFFYNCKKKSTFD